MYVKFDPQFRAAAKQRARDMDDSALEAVSDADLLVQVRERLRIENGGGIRRFARGARIAGSCSVQINA